MAPGMKKIDLFNDKLKQENKNKSQGVEGRAAERKEHRRRES